MTDTDKMLAVQKKTTEKITHRSWVQRPPGKPAGHWSPRAGAREYPHGIEDPFYKSAFVD